MKTAFLLFAFLLMAMSAKAQEFTDNQKQYMASENLLLNPGFEAGKSSWVNTAGTVSLISSGAIRGKSFARITLSAQALNFGQDSVRYATAFADGVNGTAYIRAKTTMSDIYLCRKQAGVVIDNTDGVKITDCVSIPNSGKWSELSLPLILGATSNGLAMVSLTSSTAVSLAVSGTIDLDDSKLEVGSRFQSVDQSRIAGESYFAGTASCGPTRTSTTIGAFTASAACPGPTIVNSSMGSWQTTDADLMKQTINNLPAGTYKAKFFFRLTLATSGNTGFAINDGTTTCEPVYGPTGGIGQYTQTVVECTFVYTSAGNRTFELYGGSSANAITLSNDTVTPRVSTKFILEYFGSSSVYTANCGANCVDSFNAKVSSTSVVSGENVDTFVNGNCAYSSGDTTCTFGTGIFTVAPTCSAITVAASGTVASITSVSTSTIVIRTKTASTAADGQFAFNLFCDKTGADFTASRSIIGTFNEVVTSPGVSKPKVCHYAFGGASSTLAAPTECTTGTCVEVFDSCGTGSPPTNTTTSLYYALTFASGTFANNAPMYCKCQGWDTTTDLERSCDLFYRATGSGTSWASNSTGGASLNMFTHLGGASTQGTAYVNVVCEGQAP